MQLIHRIGISAVALVLSSGLACAAPALTLSDLKMRIGPDTDSPVVIAVPGGSNVDVLGCDESVRRNAIFFQPFFIKFGQRAFP
jgi:uncharacterized protein YraI